MISRTVPIPMYLSHLRSGAQRDSTHAKCQTCADAEDTPSAAGPAGSDPVKKGWL